MADEPIDPSMEVELVAQMLRSDGRESADFLENLAHKLEGALPEMTRVERKGGLFSREKRVASIRVEMENTHYLIRGDKRGPVAEKAKVVRGVRLATKSLPVEDWIRELAAEVHKLAAESAATRQALEKFITGD